MEKPITWEDVIKAADEALTMLGELMNTDPQHGVLYQQRMAVMMERKQRAIYLQQQEKNNNHSNRR